MLDATNLVAPQQRAVRSPQSGALSEAAMRKSAKDFEAQALGFLLQPIFATVDMSESSFGGGAAEAQWRPMLVEAFAASAVRAGGVGIGVRLPWARLRPLLRRTARPSSRYRR